jgi:hypothetical protein
MVAASGERMCLNDGHGHSYAGYLAFARRGRRRGLRNYGAKVLQAQLDTTMGPGFVTKVSAT